MTDTPPVSKPIPNEPLGATDAWRTAVLRADLTCQCRYRECGKAHSASGGECDQTLTTYGGVRLHLIETIERGPIVVCGDCFDGRRRIANRTARLDAEDRLEAYALPGLSIAAIVDGVDW